MIITRSLRRQAYFVTRSIATALSFALVTQVPLAPSARAFDNVSPTSFSSFTNDLVGDLLKTVGGAADHRAYMPATPLGMLLGFDIGIDGTYFPFPSSFTNALSQASGQTGAQLPSGLFLPKLNLHKGLPLGIDVGGSLMALSSGSTRVFSSYALDVKWAFFDQPVLPTIAARLSYSSNKIYFINTSALTLDAVASKDLLIVDPYVGLGLQRWMGSLTVPGNIPQPPAGVSTDASGMNFHAYVGAQLKLTVFRLTAQAEYSTAGFTTFGGKLSFGF